MSKRKHSLAEHAKEAAVAHTDITSLYLVIALLEGRALSVAHQRAESQIIRICKAEAQKALARHDKHMDAIKSGWVQ